MPEQTATRSGGSQREDLTKVRVRNAIIFACIAIGWIVLDRITKAFFNAYEVGAGIAEPLPGILGFKLMHNTGGAWGVLGDMTPLLALLALVICVGILWYLFIAIPDASVLLTVGLSLVFAGGIGNFIDRVTGGYVIDFIQTLFMDFPVFNIADIGVTCGVVITLIALFACPHTKIPERED